PWMGFLFGWAQLVVIRTGNIGMMAYVFGHYATALWNFGEASTLVYAVGSVTVLTTLNMLGVVLGKGVQNLLTAAKVLGLGGILVAGTLSPHVSIAGPIVALNQANIALAMVFVMFTYGGWNDAALVAAEVRDPRRNIPRALILGTCIITLIYVLVNAAYVRGL